MQHQDSGPSGDASPPVALHGAPAAERQGLDPWLRSHLDLIALLVVAVGFVLRAVTAANSYLNPDEALHYIITNQPTPIFVYKASLGNAHPPLFFQLLYFWRVIGNSELALRFLSVLAGTALLWVGFKWLEKAFNTTAGVIGLLLLTFSPTMISLSAEVRGYAVLLLCMASALYMLERAVEERSPRLMALFSLFLYLAILTHYSALWFTLALGVYGLLRIVGRQLPARVVRVWVGVQVGAAALYALLYVTHLSKLRGSPLEQQATSGWLEASYFRSGKESPLLFPLKGSVALFQYLFAQSAAGTAMLLVFLAGVVFLLAKGVARERNQATPRDLGMLLFLPFVLNGGAALAGLYPYGGTRHSVFLALFAMAGVSVPLAHLAGKKVLPVVLAAGVLMPVWNLSAVPPGQHIAMENQRQALMRNAVNYIRQSIPPGGLLFVDYHASVILGYYLGKDQIIRFNAPQTHKDFFEFPYGGYRVVSSKVWLFNNVENFGTELSRLRRVYGLAPEELVWVVSMDRGVNIYPQLTRRLPEVYLPGVMFGANLAVFQVPAGLELPTRPVQRR